jgi:hypothetical protein
MALIPHPAFLCAAAAGAYVLNRRKRKRNHRMPWYAIGQAPDGELYFSSADAPVGDWNCPTGETCSDAELCKCSGVAADGTVGPGASCECIKASEVPGVTPLPGKKPKPRRRRRRLL